jgi:hypothetical protein
MTLQDRDKRALAVCGVALALGFIYWIAGPSSTSRGPRAAVAVDTVDRAEKRLANLQNSLATLDGKQALLKQATSELAEREKGLIVGDTAEQAQAQLLQIVRRVAKAQTPALEIRQSELRQPRPFGDAYGQVTVAVTIDCRIDELINLLAALGEQPELLASEDLRFGAANPKLKSMPVQLTVSGLVPRRLVPEKKGLTTL